MLPEVISHGIIIEDRINHKNRSVNTKTIGGYVRINGIDSFIGVVVRTGGKNRDYIHRVILSDGAELIFDNKKTEPIGVGITANGDKRSTISSVYDIIPNNRKESNGRIKESLRDSKDTTGKSAKLTENRIKRLYSDYGASNPKYAQAYITSIHPRDFLKLTISDDMLKEWDNVGRELDLDELRDETQTPFLKFDEETGRVEGHEGRHRMKALLDAGVTEVPIALIDMSTKYSKEQKDSQELFSQIFWDEEPINSNARVEVNNLIPINEAYDDIITKAYGEGGDIRFSLSDNNGRKLSDAQQEYFKDSKVRDESGNEQRYSIDYERRERNITRRNEENRAILENSGIEKASEIADFMEELGNIRHKIHTNDWFSVESLDFDEIMNWL